MRTCSCDICGKEIKVNIDNEKWRYPNCYRIKAYPTAMDSPEPIDTEKFMNFSGLNVPMFEYDLCFDCMMSISKLLEDRVDFMSISKLLDEQIDFLKRNENM